MALRKHYLTFLKILQVVYVKITGVKKTILLKQITNRVTSNYLS